MCSQDIYQPYIKTQRKTFWSYFWLCLPASRNGRAMDGATTWSRWGDFRFPHPWRVFIVCFPGHTQLCADCEPASVVQAQFSSCRLESHQLTLKWREKLKKSYYMRLMTTLYLCHHGQVLKLSPPSSSTGNWTQGLLHERQAFCHLRHIPSPVIYILFSKWVLPNFASSNPELVILLHLSPE